MGYLQNMVPCATASLGKNDHLDLTDVSYDVEAETKECSEAYLEY